jgi:hypothetical protein
MNRFLVVLSLAWVLALGSAGATAQAAGPVQVPLAQKLVGEAKEAFDSAQILSNNGDFAGALAKYQQAYDLSKDPRLLFNMAICARSQHAWARMQTLLRQYEHEAGRALSTEDRSEVDSALAAIRNLVGTVTLAVAVPGAVVTIDGDQVGVTPLAAPIVLDLGKHTLAVSKPGFDTATQTVVIAGGSETNVAVALVAQRHISQLRVRSDEHAKVSLDGAIVGEGSFEGPVGPGAHQLEVTEDGKVTYKTDLDLHEGETRTVQVTLEDENHGAPIWPWVLGGAVVAAGAAVGGYFLFKPSDTVTPVPTGRFGSVTFQ